MLWGSHDDQHVTTEALGNFFQPIEPPRLPVGLHLLEGTEAALSRIGKRFPTDPELLATISDHLADSFLRTTHQKHLSTDSTGAQALLQEVSRSLRENIPVAVYDHDLVRDRFRKAVEEVLLKPGWDEKRLAQELGVDPKSIENWVDGKTGSIKLERLVLIAQIAGKDLGWLGGLSPFDLGSEILARLDDLSARIRGIEEALRPDIVEMKQRPSPAIR